MKTIQDFCRLWYSLNLHGFFLIWVSTGSKTDSFYSALYNTAFFPFFPQITGQARASPRWTSRCARASWQALCAPSPCAVPPWGGPGATPVRCALPSPSPAAAASSRISALGPAKVSSRCNSACGNSDNHPGKPCSTLQRSLFSLCVWSVFCEEIRVCFAASRFLLLDLGNKA